MNYKKWIYDELNNYQYQKKALSLIPDKIETLRQRAESIRIAGYDKTPGGGGSADEMLIANIAERQTLEKNLKAARADIERIDAAIAELPMEEQKAIIYCVLYPQRGGIIRLQSEIGYEKTQAYKIKDNAIKHLALILHGKAEV